MVFSEIWGSAEAQDRTGFNVEAFSDITQNP